jgi:O-antigen/teichoic acid export membrane protein
MAPAPTDANPRDDPSLTIASSSLPDRIGSRSVLRNSLLLFGFHVLTKLLAFVSFILLANYLGTQLFGTYNYAFALTALFIPLCDLGMDTYLMREVPRVLKDRLPKQVGAVLALKGALTFLVFVAISITGGILDSFGSERFYIVALAGLVTLLRTYWTTFGSLLRALNKVGYEAGLLSLARAAEFLVIVGSIWYDAGLLSLLSILGVVNLISVAATYFVVRSRFTAPTLERDFEHMLMMLKGGLPFALTTIFTSIYFNFDTVLVAKFIGDDAAGIYRAAYNLILPLIMITAAVSGAVFPFVSQSFRTHKEDVARVLQRSATHLIMIALPIAVATTLLSNEIIRLLFEPSYAPAAVCLSILVWFIPIVYLTNLFGNSLGAMDQQHFVLRVTTLNVIFNVGANLIVIPHYAQIGASVTTVATELLGFSFLVVRMKREIGSFVKLGALMRIVLAALVMSAFLFFKPDLHVLLLLALSVLIYLASLLLLRALSIDEIRQLISAVRSNPSGT